MLLSTASPIACPTEVQFHHARVPLAQPTRHDRIHGRRLFLELHHHARILAQMIARSSSSWPFIASDHISCSTTGHKCDESDATGPGRRLIEHQSGLPIAIGLERSLDTSSVDVAREAGDICTASAHPLHPLNPKPKTLTLNR